MTWLCREKVSPAQEESAEAGKSSDKQPAFCRQASCLSSCSTADIGNSIVRYGTVWYGMVSYSLV